MPDRKGAEYWHDRAEEARTQASEMRNPAARRTLLEIAENYDQLAEQAETKRRTGITLMQRAD